MPLNKETLSLLHLLVDFSSVHQSQYKHQEFSRHLYYRSFHEPYFSKSPGGFSNNSVSLFRGMLEWLANCSINIAHFKEQLVFALFKAHCQYEYQHFKTEIRCYQSVMHSNMASCSAILLQEKGAYPINSLFHIISIPFQSSPYSIQVIRDTRLQI